MKKIIFLIVTGILFSCNTKEPNTKSSLELSKQEKVDADNIKHFFDLISSNKVEVLDLISEETSLEDTTHFTLTLQALTLTMDFTM